MTPFELVLQHYTFPPHIHPFSDQVEAINALAVLDQEGEWLDMGCGKTFCSTATALYRKIQTGCRVVVIMPPILLRQWERWLKSITPALSVCRYQGTPTERKGLSLDVDFVLVSAPIFKKEYDRFFSFYQDKPVHVIVDEATIVANIGSATHETIYNFCLGLPRALLSGTPTNKPGDAYGLLKFVAPGTYRNKKQFENLHVDERDFYDNPKVWKNLDVLNENMKINSRRILLEDLYPGTEEPLFIPEEYSLDSDHMKLYRKLASEELLKLPDGGKIDATTANKLRHALGQIIVNHDHFSGNPKASSAALDLIEQKLLELGDKKLVVFADYRMTISQIVRRFAKYGARAINSEVTAKQKDINVDAFISDPKCRLLVVQFVSGGKGLDGLQHVCHHCMFIEPCLQPRDFHQAIARLKRLGQRHRVLVYIATATGTLQVRGFKTLVENDSISAQVVRTAYELKQIVFGN